MKRKSFTVGLACLFLSFCASSPQLISQKPYRELRVYENITVDHLWKSCELALEELGFEIKEASKNKGLIEASWEEKELRGRDLPQDRRSSDRVFRPSSAYLSLFISESKGKASLFCEAETRGGPHTADRKPKNKREAKSFFEKLDKFLIKK
jgi:hypothetical protein